MSMPFTPPSRRLPQGQPMITLYNVPVSSYGAKVRIILAHKGIELSLIHI